MKRILAIGIAALAATASAPGIVIAARADPIRFTLEPERGDGGKIHAEFRTENNGGKDDHEWSTGFMPGDLAGLDLAGFRGAGVRPLHFAIEREAGRLDCSGRGGERHAWGDCSFSMNPQFAQLLQSRGIATPTRREGMGLLALNVRREIIDAISAARYPTPTISQLMALTAVGVTGDYINAMARMGYRPATLQSLVEFKALGITPEWIGGYVRAGYAGLPGEDLVQLKAMNISPEFIAGFDRAGYRHLPVSTLVQLKALDISPEFVRSASAGRSGMPPIDELVQMRIFGRRR